jgi:hypothetical protein
VVFVIRAIHAVHSLSCGGVRNFFKRCQLAVEFGDSLLQHLAVSRVGGGVKLLAEALPGEPQSFSFPVPLLLVGRKWRMDGLPLLRHLFLLLFDGLTFPAACHWGILRQVRRSWWAYSIDPIS